MDTLILILKIIIALGIINVWIFRFNKPTEWRGGEAQNMNDEFLKYGLPTWFVPVIGFLKIGFATILVLSIWNPEIAIIGATGMAILMIGAIGMHIKIGDSIKRSVPAFLMLVMSAVIIYSSLQ
ncbi:DoxX family protein [Psychroflexus aestuariivivens]|uniref:DoxX family protein n=1 Tax=Psychroflexus aestuariivivens TaxID=1795040 RepID=UPI000FDAAAEC|nr:DoxX family protein [Psychroflexus aestuariivivens]